jgi:hypothetical protein
MIRGRNLATTMLLAATITFVGGHASEAQDQTPPPRMLLNLDLFVPQHDNGAPGQNAANGGDSMLQQLRALRSMGYLSNDGPLPDVDDDSDASGVPAPASQKNQGGQQ